MKVVTESLKATEAVEERVKYLNIRFLHRHIGFFDHDC